jgi:hypothetical protein
MFRNVLGSPLGTGPDDTESLANSNAPHLRCEPSNVIPHARLDVLRRGRCALQRVDFGVAGFNATADASKIVAISGHSDRLKFAARRQAIKPTLARR